MDSKPTVLILGATGQSCKQSVHQWAERHKSELLKLVNDQNTGNIQWGK